MVDGQGEQSSCARCAALDQDVLVLREQLAQTEAACAWQRGLVETLPAGVLFANARGEITLANPATRALLGGHVSVSVYHPSDGYSIHHPDGTVFPAYDLPIVRALQHGESTRSVSLLIRTAGTERILTAAANPIRDAEGGIAGAVATIYDVTARLQAEEACRDLLNEHAAILHSVADALVVYAPDETIRRMNGVAERLLNYTPEEQQLPLIELMRRHAVSLPDGTPLPAERIPSRRSLQGESVHGEIVAFHPTPEKTLWLSVSSAPVLSPEGRIQGAVAVYTDITAQQNYLQERERLLTTIEEQVAELDAMIISMPHAVAMYSPNGEIIHTNDCGVDTLGFTRDECRLPMEARWAHMRAETPDGKPFPLHEVPARYAMQGQVLRNAEVMLHRPEGLRWLLVSAAPVRVAERIIGAVAIFTDITEWKTAELALRESERNLARSQAVAHIGHWGWNVEEDHFTCSEEIYRILGSSREESSGSFADLTARIPAEEREDFDGCVAEILAGKPQAQYEFRIVRPDGMPRTLLALIGEMEARPDGALRQIFGVLQDITERKRVEDALRDSEERYRVLSEAGTEGIVIHTSGVILEVNHIIAEHLGYRPEEMSGRSVLDFVAPESHEMMRRRMQDEDPGPYTAFSLHKDGTRTIGEIRARQFVYQGLPVRLVAMRDVTDLKHAEDALRESEERYRALSEASTEGIVVHERGNILEVNQILAAYLGYRAEELIGRSVLDFVAPESREEMACRIQAADPDPLPFFAVSLHKDGLRTLWEVRARQFTYKGRLVRLVAMRDITELKRSEEERAGLLAEVERRVAELDTTLNAMGDGLIIYSATGEILLDNPATRRMLDGVLLDEEYGEGDRWLCRKATTPDGHPCIPEHAPGARAALGETVTGEMLVFRQQDGTECWVSVTAAPIRRRDEGIIGVVSTYTDITALHQLQERQNALLNAISHDLRTPLAIINGHAQLLETALGEAGLNGDLRMNTDSILRAVQRMNVMIGDLVDSARAEGGQLVLKLQPIALAAYVQNLLERARTALDVLRIHLDIPDDLPPVFADHDRLERIFTNLLSNALKYSDPDSPVELSARALEGAVECAVADQGRGIDPEAIPHLFERYYRAQSTRNTDGIGLGLSITRALVEAHGGQIRVESELDKGSTFYFTLPQSKIDN